MRLCESTKVRGLVLVSAYITDLGDANERASGWVAQNAHPVVGPKIRSDARLSHLLSFSHQSTSARYTVTASRGALQHIGTRLSVF